MYQLLVANSWEEAIFLSQTKKKQLFEPMSLEQVASFFPRAPVPTCQTWEYFGGNPNGQDQVSVGPQAYTGEMADGVFTMYLDVGESNNRVAPEPEHVPLPHGLLPRKRSQEHDLSLDSSGKLVCSA